MNPATRPSPLDSLSFAIGGQTVRICSGRSSLRGRTMIGGEAVPYGSLEVRAGMYALDTVPGESEWEIIINRSYQQWGRENTYTAEVRAQELGRVTVPVERVEAPIETFTIRAEPPGGRQRDTGAGVAERASPGGTDDGLMG